MSEQHGELEYSIQNDLRWRASGEGREAESASNTSYDYLRAGLVLWQLLQNAASGEFVQSIRVHQAFVLFLMS